MRQGTTLVSAALLALLTACSDSSDNFNPLPPSLLERYELSSEDSVPEGIAFDPTGRSFYASSLQGGSITAIAADGQESLFREPDNSVQLGGLKVDAERNRLWVCASSLDRLDDRVWLFDLDSGELLHEFPLAALTTSGRCNDLVLDESGKAYVTDPGSPYLYLLDATTGEGEVFASDPLFEDASGINLGLNGISMSPDGNALIVARFFPSALLRVSLPLADEISAITLSGDSLPATDGLALLDGDIYAVSNSAVSRVRLTADNRSGEVVVVPQVEGLSTAAVAEGELYVIKSEVVNFVLERPLQTPFLVFEVDLAPFGE